MKIYSKKEAAAYLGVHVNTLSKIIKEGYINSTLVGKRRRFTDIHLNEYLKRNEIIN